MKKKTGCVLLLSSFFLVQASFADEWQVRFRMTDMDSAAYGETIEKFVRDLYGVDEVELTIPTRSITVTFESSDIDLDALKEKIVTANFSIEKTIPLKEG